MIMRRKKANGLGISIITFILVFLCLQNVNAGNHYIAETGIDYTNDGTITAPWKTFLYALSHSEAGDTIMVLGGKYTEEIIFYGSLGGLPGAPKTLMAYPGEEVILSRSRIVISSDFIRIQGFILDQNPIQVISGDYIEIINNRLIILSGFAGIWFYQGTCSHNLIQGNVFETNDQLSALRHGIYFDGGIYNVIRDNIITGFCENGIYIFDEYATTSNLIIQNNYIMDSKFRSGIALGTAERSRIDSVLILNNVIKNNAEFGIEIVGRVLNVDIFHNTLIQPSLQDIPYVCGNDRSGIYIAEGAELIDIKNNIFYNKDSLSTHINVLMGLAPISISHNLYWPNESQLMILSEGWENIVGTFDDEYPIIGDPLFVDEEGNDFNLLYGSPAINSGIDVGLPYIGLAPDLGAFESVYTNVKVANAQMPNQFKLMQNYPNPFNPSTIINYSLPSDMFVNLSIYNIAGQKIKTLINGYQQAGISNVMWDGKDENGNELSSGTYIYKLSADNYISSKKMVLLR